MHRKITVVYNEPVPSKYWARGEEKAVCGVLDEVSAVNEALLALGYEVEVLPQQPPMSLVREKLANLKTPLVFNLFEGFDGCPETEAEVAHIMEELGLCFTGSPSSVLALAQNKARAKQVFCHQGIATPDYQVLTVETLPQFRLNFPCITKPVGEDASHGISGSSVVQGYSTLEEQVRALSQAYGSAVLVEEFVGGREFNATVIGNEQLLVFPPTEIIYTLPAGKPHILTFSAKWVPEDDYFNGTQARCPAEVETELRQEIENMAVAAFRALGCRGYARADMRQNATGKLMVLEVNPNPDVSPGTGAPRQAQAAGLTYEQFISKIISLAIEGRQVAEHCQ